MIQIENLAKRKIIKMIANYHNTATDFRAVMIKKEELILCDFSEDNRISWKNSDLEIPYKKIMEVIRMIGGKGRHFTWCKIEMSLNDDNAMIELYKDQTKIDTLKL